jgi:hypothetical protein
MKISNFLKPTPVSIKVAAELHQAKLDQLAAEASKEYWNNITRMLAERIQRLESHTRQNTLEKS